MIQCSMTEYYDERSVAFAFKDLESKSLKHYELKRWKMKKSKLRDLVRCYLFSTCWEPSLLRIQRVILGL